MKKNERTMFCTDTNFKTHFFVKTVSILLLIFNLSIIGKKNDTKGKTMSPPSTIINRNPFADLQKTSYIPVKGKLGSKEKWLLSIEKLGNLSEPLFLSNKGNVLIIGYNKSVISVDIEKKDIIWQQPIRRKFIFDCNEKGILIGRHNERRSYVSNNITKKIIGVSANDVLTFFTETQNGHIHGSFNIPERKMRAREAEKHMYHYIRSKKGQNSCEWGYIAYGRSLGSLVTKDLKTFYIIMPTEIHYFPTFTTNDKDVKVQKLNTIKTCSMDHTGNLLIIEQEKEGLFLKKYDPTFKELWRVPITDLAETGQPPASTPNGIIYYAEGNSIIAIKDGKILWKKKMLPVAGNIFITVLADNSLLAAERNSLYHILENGDTKSEYNNAFTITCRPIMDEKGRVYFGGKEGIGCLE